MNFPCLYPLLTPALITGLLVLFVGCNRGSPHIADQVPPPPTPPHRDIIIVVPPIIGPAVLHETTTNAGVPIGPLPAGR